MEQQDPAPALGRGLELIRILDREGPLSLERLTAVAGWPKSSVLRLLTSLCHHRVAERDPASLRYRLRERLLPVGGGRLRRAWDALVAALPPDYPHTLELHAWDGTRLTMVDRRDPDVGELRVAARIGFQRDLAEFDALTQLAMACGGAQVPREQWFYGDDGSRRPLATSRRREVLRRVRGAGRAVDPGPNTNGVVRSAIAVRDDDALLGIVAAAQVARPDTDPEPAPELPDP